MSTYCSSMRSFVLIVMLILVAFHDNLQPVDICFISFQCSQLITKTNCGTGMEARSGHKKESHQETSELFSKGKLVNSFKLSTYKCYLNLLACLIVFKSL